MSQTPLAPAVMLCHMEGDQGAEDGLSSQLSSWMSPFTGCPKPLLWLMLSPVQSEQFAGPGGDVLPHEKLVKTRITPKFSKRKLFQVVEQR